MYPNIDQVIIVGFSAGGQFVQRYAWASGAQATEGEHSMSTRYIVGMYLYIEKHSMQHTCQLKQYELKYLPKAVR